jgi:hypothetical protein
MARLEMTCDERRVRVTSAIRQSESDSIYLVHVHVALRPTSSLEHHERKMVDQFARNHLA